MQVRLRLLEWVSCAICIVAATLMASNVGQEPMVYAMFLLTNILFIPFACANKLWGIFVLNVVYGLINSWGLWNWAL
jgi:hypothetical protein